MNRFSRAIATLSLSISAFAIPITAFAPPLQQASGGNAEQGAGAPKPAGDDKLWWKGNLHTHTLWSDGDHFPEIVTQWYLENGYHFLALSDHNILSRGERWINLDTNRYIARTGGRAAVEQYRERFGDDWVETRKDGAGSVEVRLKPLDEIRSLFEKPGRFLLIESEEISARHVVHMNATNIQELIRPLAGETVEETIRLNIDAVHSQSRTTGEPILPHLNHPNFQWAVTAEDMAPVEGLNFFEVYNGHRGVRNFGDNTRIDLDRMWDIVLTKRLAELDLGVIYGLAVDDAHHYENSTSEVARPGRGWVMVRSRELTPEHLLSALRRGDFYASSGVELERIESTLEQIYIEVADDAESEATYTIQFIGTREDYDPSREPVTARGTVGKIADITGRWVFVQAVADRDTHEQTLRVYDPEHDEWHAGSIPLPSGSTQPTGALYLPSHPDLYPFKGNLSEIRFWHTARSRADAERDMHRRLGGYERGLAGYWPVNQSPGEGLRDRAGNAEVTLQGGRITGDSPINEGGSLGTRGDDFGEVSDVRRLVPGSNNFTIEMWVKTDPNAQGWNLPLEWIGGDRIYVGHDVGAGWNFVVTTDGTRTDTQNGETDEIVPIRTTMRYSADIGEILQETQGSRATYRFRGDEIYVRARIVSSEMHPNPFASGEPQKAWVQPVIPGLGLMEAQQR